MTQLKCKAKTCMYNENDYCSKGEITVDGKHATSSADTCCASFKERTRDSHKNATMHPSKNIEIDCEAKACAYNSNCKCTAKQVGISGANASECKDTQCNTFTSK